MASVNMEDWIQKPAVCVTVFGESHEGLLQGIDNNFNTVLKQSVGNKENELTFVRGESVVYERMTTRNKIQFFWWSMLVMGFAYQFLQMTVLRVQPKREEQMYSHIRELYGDQLPPELIEIAKRQREAQDALTLSNMIRTPTPGETAGALQHALDPRRIAQLRSHNGY